MKILADTHSLFWFLTSDKRLSGKAKNALDSAKRIFIPTIVLLELLYLFLKKKKEDSFFVAFKEFKKDERYVFVSLDLTIVEEVAKLASKLEIHDCVLVSTARLLQISIVSKDSNIQKVYEKMIW